MNIKRDSLGRFAKGEFQRNKLNNKEYERLRYLKNKESKKIKCLEYYYKNKEKVLAYQKLRIKLKKETDMDFRNYRNLKDLSSRKLSLKDKSCENCGSLKDLQRHHPNYSSEFVIVLCRKCHTLLHQELKCSEVLI
jgi:hypothetical protein